MERTEGASRHRLGIYGGTFAPPHNGHVRAAREFLSQAKLDTLLVMPTAIPPHKQIDPGDDPEIRLVMARAAFDGLDSRITVSDYEIRRGGASYTYQTLTHYSETTDSELFFLCGTDMFLTLDAWRCPEIIFAKATIACVMRESDPASFRAVREKDAAYREAYGARTLFVHSVPIELSSTDIRARVRAGKSIADCVPKSVARRIAEYGLYKK